MIKLSRRLFVTSSLATLAAAATGLGPALAAAIGALFYDLGGLFLT